MFDTIGKFLVVIECQEPKLFRREVFKTVEAAYRYFDKIVDTFFPQDKEGLRKKSAKDFTAYIRNLDTGIGYFKTGPLSWAGIK